MGLISEKINSNPSPATHAFKILPIASENQDNYIINITPGTVNNIVPSNIVGSMGGLNPFSVQKDTLMYVILDCTSNGVNINSAKILIQKDTVKTQTPIAFGLPSSVQILLGAVYNTNIYQSVTSNITLGGKVQYIIDNQKNNSSLPYTIYLIWG